MAKTKISEYSSTASSNTDVDGVNLQEGCPPSGLNNSIRELMSHLKDFQTGTAGDSLTVGGNLIVSGTTTLTGNPTAPTQSPSDNSTRIATTSFVQTKTNALGTMSSQNSNAISVTGGTLSGVTVSGVVIGTNASGTRTVSTSAPTGGSDGDIWYRV